MDLLLKKWKRILKRIEKLEQDFQQQTEEINEKIINEVKSNTEELVDSKIKVIWENERDRVRRLRNVMITEMPEQTGSNEEKKRKDREDVQKLFKDHLKLSDSDFVIQSTWRIGKETTGKNQDY